MSKGAESFDSQRDDDASAEFLGARVADLSAQANVPNSRDHGIANTFADVLDSSSNLSARRHRVDVDVRRISDRRYQRRAWRMVNLIFIIGIIAALLYVSWWTYEAWSGPETESWSPSTSYSSDVIGCEEPEYLRSAEDQRPLRPTRDTVGLYVGPGTECEQIATVGRQDRLIPTSAPIVVDNEMWFRVLVSTRDGTSTTRIEGWVPLPDVVPVG